MKNAEHDYAFKMFMHSVRLDIVTERAMRGASYEHSEEQFKFIRNGKPTCADWIKHTITEQPLKSDRSVTQAIKAGAERSAEQLRKDLYHSLANDKEVGNKTVYWYEGNPEFPDLPNTITSAEESMSHTPDVILMPMVLYREFNNIEMPGKSVVWSTYTKYPYLFQWNWLRLAFLTQMPIEISFTGSSNAVPNAVNVTSYRAIGWKHQPVKLCP